MLDLTGSRKELQTDCDGHAGNLLWLFGIKAHTKWSFLLCPSCSQFMHYLCVTGLHCEQGVDVWSDHKTSMSGSSEDLCAHLNRHEQGTHFVKELLFRQCFTLGGSGSLLPAVYQLYSWALQQMTDNWEVFIAIQSRMPHFHVSFCSASLSEMWFRCFLLIF